MTFLNLGCGTKPMAGSVKADAVNHDLTLHHEYVNVAWDLDKYPWLWSDESFDDLYAVDVLEHLENIITALEECWRILKPGGRLLIRTPYGLSEISFTDPTHKHHLTPESFDYFIRGTDLEKQYGFYSPMRWVKREYRRDGDNMVWVLGKDAAVMP